MQEQKKRRKVGILGGTFDPIHTGHLILAENAYESFSLDYVLLMPNGNPPHKPGQVNATLEQRIRMVKLAVADNKHFQVSALEAASDSYHYTYETLEQLSREHPDTDYYFILGGDSLAQFHTWKEPARICASCHILAAVRDEVELDTIRNYQESLKKQYGANIELLSTPSMDISSHMIREKVQKKQSIRYYVPASVEAYIQEQKLYTLD